MKTHAKLEKEIEKSEAALKKGKEKLAALRRKLPPVEVKNYSFKGAYGETLHLSDLFGKKDELILIHNMGVKCPYCTMWADGFNGVIKHIEDRASFVLESPDDPAIQRQFGIDRGWSFKTVSSRGTTFRKDMGYANPKNEPFPGVSTFKKDSKGKIYKLSDAAFGPGDNFCSVWDLFDLLPGGWSKWDGRYFYSKVK